MSHRSWRAHLARVAAPIKPALKGTSGPVFGVAAAVLAGALGAAASVWSGDIKQCADSISPVLYPSSTGDLGLAEGSSEDGPAEQAPQDPEPALLDAAGAALDRCSSFSVGWLLFGVIWVSAFGARQIGLSLARGEEAEAMRALMLRSPNPGLVRDYPDYLIALHKLVKASEGRYLSQLAEVGELDLGPDDPGDGGRDPSEAGPSSAPRLASKQVLEQAISECVSIIATVASQFAHGMQSRGFVGNVMLFWEQPQSSQEVVRDGLHPDDEYARFSKLSASILGLATTEPKRGELSIDPDRSLRGVLELRRELSGTNLQDRRRAAAVKRVPEALVLPVPTSLLSPSGRFAAYPGAPSAVFVDGMLVYPNIEHIRTFVRKKMDLPDPTKQAVLTFFDKEEGRHIQSFLSIRIGPEDRPLGVLNIDCHRQELLGPDEEFFPTFRTFLEPLVMLIEPLVDAYRDEVLTEDAGQP